MDFNPVVNALRLIGSDRLNYAAVNSGGNLNVTAVQTALSYGPNDVNSGVAPHVSAGTYDGNDYRRRRRPLVSTGLIMTWTRS